MVLKVKITAKEALSYAEQPDYLPDCIVIVRILGGIMSEEGIAKEDEI